jgi:2-dehydro-3-deoxygalactonokinase
MTKAGNRILLISGVRTDQDVMRGEETQLLGLADRFGNGGTGEFTYIFPGTHSKHIVVKDKKIVHFETYMTGELFSLMASHSILGHSVSFPGDSAAQIADPAAFGAGVKKAFGSHLLNGLFSVRVNQIRNYLSKEDNYYYLSGLLIGTELKYIRDGNQGRFVLCGGNKIHGLYQLAIFYAGLSDSTTFVPANITENAAAEGQLKILRQIE